MEDGYIKFNLDWQKDVTEDFPDFVKINSWRKKLHLMGLIGAYSNGIGFGNLSCRAPGAKEFFITGSATGNFKELSLDQFTKVNNFDFERNWVSCAGGVKASSESLTHAAIYSCAPEINAVFHVHNKLLWNYLLKKLPSTGKNADCGTKELVQEVFRLFKESTVSNNKIFAMEGHLEGVASFGASIDEAGKVLLQYFSAVK